MVHRAVLRDESGPIYHYTLRYLGGPARRDTLRLSVWLVYSSTLRADSFCYRPRAWHLSAKKLGAEAAVHKTRRQRFWEELIIGMHTQTSGGFPEYVQYGAHQA